MSDEPEIREYEQPNGIRVRAKWWDFGTDNERCEHQYQHYCPQCRSRWWTGHHSTTLDKICPVCAAAQFALQERQEERLAEHNRRVRDRQKVILYCIGGFILLNLAAGVIGLVSRVLNWES